MSKFSSILLLLWVLQQTFFGPAEEAIARPTYGLVVLGWAVLGLLGLVYTLSPRLRKMLPRYFLNHRFYQEAIRRGREIIPVETTIILVAICGAVGLTAAVWIDLVRMSTTFTALVGSLPAGAAAALRELVPRAWITVLVVGALTALFILTWAGWLVLISNRLGDSIRFDQAFMLTIWPHWLLLIAALPAWITAGTAAIPPQALCATWLICAASATVRVWSDFKVIARVSPVHLSILSLGSPLALCLIIIAVLGATGEIDVWLLWNLLRGASSI